MSRVKCKAEASGNNWQLYLGDSCEVIKGFPENSIDFGIHSPPRKSGGSCSGVSYERTSARPGHGQAAGRSNGTED